MRILILVSILISTAQLCFLPFENSALCYPIVTSIQDGENNAQITPPNSRTESCGNFECCGCFSGIRGFIQNIRNTFKTKRYRCFDILSNFIQDFEDSSKFELNVNDSVSSKSAFKNASSIADLTSQQGNLFVFRTITAKKYLKEFPHNAFPDSGHGYSYSLEPRMPLHWTYYGGDNDLILIASQSIEMDQLSFPTEGAHHELTPRTSLNEIIYYNEVKVPRNKENVIAIIKKKHFRAIVEKCEKQDHCNVLEIVQAVGNSSKCFLPE